MVSKNQQKKIKQLKQKKYRSKFGLFVAEGEKVVNDLINSKIECEYLFSIKNISHPKAFKVKESEMKKLVTSKIIAQFLEFLKYQI